MSSLAIYGLTGFELALAASRYLIFASASLLALKHIVWTVRGYYTNGERRAGVRPRAGIEFLTSAILAVAYADQLFFRFEGPMRRLDDPQSAVAAWTISLLLLGLLFSRPERDRTKEP